MPRFNTRNTLILCALAASTPALAAAVCPAGQSHCSQSTLEEVIVTARRSPEVLMDASASVSVINGDQLARSLAYGLADTMRDVPGIQITDSGQPGLKRIRMRGEESRRTAILIDGQEITDHWEVGTPLSLNPALVERVEVVRGSGSVLYGSRALSGVINFITRKGGSKPLQLEASSGWNSATHGDDWFLSAFGNLDGTQYRVAVAESTHGKRDTPDGRIENTAFDNNSVYAWLGHDFGAHHLAFNYDNYESSTDVFVEDSVKHTFPLVDFRIDVPQRDREKFALFYEWDDVGTVLHAVKANVHRQYNDRKFDTFTATLIPGAVPILTERSVFSNADLQVTDGVLQLDWLPAANHYLVSGLQFTEEQVNQERHVDTLVNHALRPAEDLHDEATIKTVALFLQDDWQIGERSSLNVGARRYQVEGTLDRSNRPGLQASHNGDDATVLSIGVTHALNEDLVLRASAAQGYVYPSLLQFATGAYAGSRYVNPNPDLDPEHSRNVELGARLRRFGWAFDAGVFHSKSKDYIDHVFCAPDSGCLSSRDKIYINVGDSDATGLEFFAMREPGTSGLRPYANLTWMQRSNRYENFVTDDSGTPSLAGSIGMLVEGLRVAGLDAWLDLVLRGENSSRREEPSSSGTAVLNEDDSWISCNISGGARFGPDQNFKLIMELENITDERYSTSAENLLAPGRSIAARISYTLN